MPAGAVLPARDAWALIWGDGRMSAHPGTLDHALLKSWWDAELGKLPPIETSIEVGAGALPLPSLCLHAAQPDAAIVACDVRPPPLGPSPGITHVADAAIEALPFADGAFDLMLAQFAFEYADRETAIAEARRVLRTGGFLRLVIHHHRSHIALHLADRIDCLELGSAVSSAVTARGPRELRRGKLRRALAAVDRLLQTASDPQAYEDLRDFHRIASAVLAGGSISEEDSLLIGQAQPALTLALAQQAATQSRDGIATFRADLNAAGFDIIEITEIADGRGPLAWGLCAEAAQRGRKGLVGSQLGATGSLATASATPAT